MSRQRSDEAKAYRKLYKRKAWRMLKLHALLTNPMCAICKALGRDRAASVIDHIEPHKGDQGLFFDAGNLQSLCAECHNGLKQSFERGNNRAIAADGWKLWDDPVGGGGKPKLATRGPALGRNLCTTALERGGVRAVVEMQAALREHDAFPCRPMNSWAP